MGGSIVRALRNSPDNFHISAFDISDATDKALTMNLIDEKLNDISESLNSDLIFICLPVDNSIEVFEQLADKLSENQIITDVCSVKSLFQEIWDKKKRKGYYIGGHPMTGKEKGEFDNSDPLLYENCTYILNDNSNAFPMIDLFTELIHKLGARITYLNPKVHDIIVASVSHLPQLVSVSLINSASLKDSELNFFDYAAGGFRDMTRIASSDFCMWEPIIRMNAKNIVQAIDNFIYDLEMLKNSILNRNMDFISERFESARVKRDEIPKSNKGFINAIFDLYVYVKDQPGALSKITTALYEARINIKDIELLKIRAGSGGTFRIAFETQKDAGKAKIVIEQTGFVIKV